MCGVRAQGSEQWYPTLRKEREGWGTRRLVFFWIRFRESTKLYWKSEMYTQDLPPGLLSAVS